MSKCRDCGEDITFPQKPEGGYGRPLNTSDNSPHNCKNKGQRPERTPRSSGKSAGEQHDIRHEAVLNTAVALGVGKLQAGVDPGTITPEWVVSTARIFLAFVEDGRPADAPVVQPSTPPNVTSITAKKQEVGVNPERCAVCNNGIGSDGEYAKDKDGIVRPLCRADYNQLIAAKKAASSALGRSHG